MFRNYLVIAWRQLLKNKLYASINVLGLVVGLAIYLFSWLLIGYERSHDAFFVNADRIFTVGSVFSPAANVGVAESDGVYTAFGPFIRTEVEGIEALARTVGREFLLSVEDDHYYERVCFADPELLDIFDFVYLEGDATALDDPSGVLLTRETARKLFGEGPALGRTLTLDHRQSLRVTAVIDELPLNTHLVNSAIDDRAFNVVAPLEALNNVSGYDLAGNFNNLSSGDFTYMLLPEGTSRDWLQAQLDGIFERHFNDPERRLVTGLKVRPLVEANTILWDAVGLPILDSVRMLGLLVLVVAIVNYTNLATAQSLGRAREIGLRKTMGAARSQLVTQFLIESLFVAVIAMFIAVAVIELVIPLFNTAADKSLTIDYLGILPWLSATTVATGLVAGAYPAYLITQVSPIDALRDGGAKGVRGGLFRGLMLGLQFSITIFMLAMVMVIYLQNQNIEQSASIYPRSQIISLNRLDVESIRERLDTLGNELRRLPGVTHVTFTSQLPYEQSNSAFTASRDPGGEAAEILLSHIIVDEHFTATFDIPMLVGRFLDRANTADTVRRDALSANAVVNELAVSRLGFTSAQEALGQVFYQRRQGEAPRALSIVGVLPDQNYQGFHNRVKPTAFYMFPESIGFGAVRVEGVAMGQALAAVESVWESVIPDYPVQSEFLDEDFNETFRIYQGLSTVLGGFAGIALLLSLIGLFGLAAFMAAGRTKEIGIRKVMGAKVHQIVRLLIWQFSRPVLWAVLMALPLSYLAAGAYLNFFAERIPFTMPVVAGAGVLAVVFAWSIVAVHAYRVARANPIHALRCE